MCAGKTTVILIDLGGDVLWIGLVPVRAAPVGGSVCYHMLGASKVFELDTGCLPRKRRMSVDECLGLIISPFQALPAFPYRVDELLRDGAERPHLAAGHRLG